MYAGVCMAYKESIQTTIVASEIMTLAKIISVEFVENKERLAETERDSHDSFPPHNEVLNGSG
jgi:hypothetical protein